MIASYLIFEIVPLGQILMKWLRGSKKASLIIFAFKASQGQSSRQGATLYAN